MRKKINKYGAEKFCPNCNCKLKFSWLSGMSAPHIFLYSEKSDEILVSQELLKMYSESNFDDAKFSSKLEKYLRDRKLIFGGFSMSNPLRCPNCSLILNKRSDGSVSDKLREKAVYLDGMVYRNDKEAFIVEVT